MSSPYRPTQMTLINLKLFPLLFLCFSISSSLPAQAVKLIIDGQLQIKEKAAENHILQSDPEGWGTWVAPTYQQRKVIDVTDFGAVSNTFASQTAIDNIVDFQAASDNTLAFQAAIDSAATFGGTVFIPAGNYLISDKLSIPSGVILQGESQGNVYHRGSTSPFKGSTLFYTGSDYMLEFSGFFSGARDLYFYKIGAGAPLDKGCIHLIANDGNFSTGHNTFANLTIYNFTVGTCLKIAATKGSEIKHVLIEDVLFRFPETGMHILAEKNSKVEHITLNNGKIGGGSHYSFRNQGGTNINVYGTTFEGTACGSFGHLVVESGNINIYGFRTESTDPEGVCDESKIKIVHLHPNTTGSYIQGLVGEGAVIDEGDNYLNITGKNIERRPSDNNQFQNSAFRNVQHQQIPFWDLTGNVVSSNIEAPVFEANHQVLTLTIAPGQIVNLSPNTKGLSIGFHQLLATFGAYIKTDVANLATGTINRYNLSDNSCSEINANFHSGNGEWEYIGLSATIKESTCSVNPNFIFDNSTGSNNAVVSITTPSLVFGTTRPTLTAKSLSKNGGIVNGTLTHGMTTVPIVVNDNFELTLPKDGNTFLLTGTTPIHRLNNHLGLGPRFPKGTIITLVFDTAGVSIKNWAYINLFVAGNFTSTAGSSLTLVALADGTWREISRNL